ncbi:MAG: hypothetical protein ABSB74_01000 [Tepidisphaeraceae bacterium]
MLRKRATRRLSNRLARFYQLASSVQIEMLEKRVLLSATNPIAPPPLPDQPEPLQGVVGTPQSLDPAMLNDAYGFNAISYDSGGLVPANGTGQTIAIVDPYGSPTIIQDLETFDAHWGISNNDGTGQFALTIQQLTTPAGQAMDTNPSDYAGWAKETSLDVEWAHAVAPGAHILLVEAPLLQTLNADGSPNFLAIYQQLVDSMDADVYAASYPGVVDVSMSWGIDNGAVPGPGSTATIAQYINPDVFDGYMVTPTGHLDSSGIPGGVAFLAASGDTSTLSWPSTSQEVISVGGEFTDVGLNGVVQTIGPWGLSGGGDNPNYTTHWNVAIVALDADPLTGVWVYDSTPDEFGQVGWGVVGGTSFSCPAWAGLIAIIDQGLSYRRIGSLTTGEALDGGYDERPAGYDGILGLMEAGIVDTPNTALQEPDGHYTFQDLDTLNPPPGTPLTSYPLWNTTTGPIPDITKTPVNGNTGWGAPDSGAFHFVEDMVGDEHNANDALNLTVPDGSLPQLEFSVQPTSETAGQVIPATVTAYLNGTVDASFTGSVTLNLLGPPGSTLTGITTVVHAVGGVAIFSNLTIDTDGSYQLIASGNGANGADSAGFVISSGPIAQLNFIDQPTSLWQYGSLTGPLILGIEDQFGNVVTSVNSTVILAIAVGPLGGTIIGNTSAVASNGQATFTGLKFNVPGTYKLIATDGSLSVTSNAFEVVPIPVPLHYTFNGAALSEPAILFEQLRNAPLYTSKSAPTAAQIAQVFAADNNLQSLTGESVVSAAVQVAPSTFAAASTPIGDSSDSVAAQLLDTNNSGVNQLLDN